MMIRRTPFVLAALAVLGRASSTVAQGCAMCGGSFGQNDPTTNAFNTSILFMMLAPYAIFFSAAAVVVFLYRRGLLARRAPVIPLHRRRMPAPADGPKEVTP